MISKPLRRKYRDVALFGAFDTLNSEVAESLESRKSHIPVSKPPSTKDPEVALGLARDL